jgi:hypothetical protein
MSTRMEESGQPCLTPIQMSTGSEQSLLVNTLRVEPLKLSKRIYKNQ